MPTEAEKALLMRSARQVRIKPGVRPYGGRKMDLVRYEAGNNTVVVRADTKAGNSMIGADHRVYRLHEVDPA